MGRWSLVVIVVLAAGWSSGCATYDERMEQHHRAFYGGRLPDALRGLRDDVEDAGEDHLDLARLELASALQASGEYVEAAEQLTLADDELEVLDYVSDPAEQVLAFTASGEIERYRATPPERVMVNTQGMINRLAAGDLSGAQVEARRLGILLDQSDIPEDEKYANAFAVGLAGFCLEKGGNPLESRDFRSRLGPDDPFAAPPRDPEAPTGTVLLITQTGKAPIRREAVFVLWIDGLPRTLRIPAMVRRDAGFTRVGVTVDGESRGDVPTVFDYGEHLMRRYDDELPALLSAAAVQAAIRAAAAEVAKEAAESATSDEDWSLLTGFLAGTFMEFGLGSVMTTDTRCWSLLPGGLGAMRLELPPGTHTIGMEFRGGAGLLRKELHSVQVTPGGLAVINAVTDIHGGYVPPPEPREVDDPDDPAVMKALAAFETAFAIHAILD